MNTLLNELDWIVIPGGPGLSKDYLKEPFDKVFANTNIRLHYFEPYGSPGYENNQNVTIQDLIEQIFCFAQDSNIKEFGIIAHSFGTYLALRAVEHRASKIKALILLSPMPLKYKDWQCSLSTIASRISPSVLDKLEKYSLSSEDKGSDIFKLIFPYYCYSHIVDIPNVKFNLKSCNSIAGQVQDYDDNDFINSLSVPLICIVGNKDPFYYQNTCPIERTIVIEGLGHYPFYENIDEFKKVILFHFMLQ